MTVPSADDLECSCHHSFSCNHGCHGRHCDPTEHVCSLEFLPDDGGLTPWGCADCTPGGRMPHLMDCSLATTTTSSGEAGTATSPFAPA